jgi:hypothetical protein
MPAAKRISARRAPSQHRARALRRRSLRSLGPSPCGLRSQRNAVVPTRVPTIAIVRRGNRRGHFCSCHCDQPGLAVIFEAPRSTQAIPYCLTVENTRLGNADVARGGDAEVEKGELIRSVSIGAERNDRPAVAGYLEEFDVEVLPVGIPINLDRSVVITRALKDSPPVALQAEAEVEDSPAGVCENVDI